MGSKRRLVHQIVDHLPGCSDIGTYFEPFFGSGAVYFNYGPRRAVLGDTNADLMNAWLQIRQTPDRLWENVRQIGTDRDNYYSARDAFKTAANPFDRAVLFIYLNRYCFNGIYRTNRQNQFNVPYGSKTGSLPTLQAFVDCSERLNGADLIVGDFEATCLSAGEGDVVYLDPPWPALRPTYGEYGYMEELATLPRLVRFVEHLVARGAYVLLSLPAVNSELPFKLGEQFSLTYSVASRSAHRLSSSELLFIAGASIRSNVPV